MLRVATVPLHRRGAKNRQSWRITPDYLRAFVETIPVIRPVEVAARTDTVLAAYHLLKMVFGSPWFDLNISDNLPGHFLYRGCLEHEVMLHVQRVVDLAEMILNFQLHERFGFDEILDKLDAGHIEAAYAELDTGKLLVRNGVTFSFHVATGKKGTSYDFDVQFQNGNNGCAETKCNLVGKTLRAASVKGTLEGARKQLPKDRPGAIFLKVPQDWLDDVQKTKELIFVGHHFLRGTDRVVSLIVYSERVIPTMRGPIDGFRVFQVLNPTHRFQRDTDWYLLPERPPEKMDVSWFSLWNMFGTLKTPLPTFGFTNTPQDSREL